MGKDGLEFIKGFCMIKKIFLFIVTIIGGLLLPSLIFNVICVFPESFGIQILHLKREAPSFSLKDLNGQELTLSGLKGTPLLLFFWGSYCPACKEDIVLLQKFAHQMGDLLQVFTIAVDGENEKRVRRTVWNLRITLPVLLDPKEKTARLYGIRMVPAAVVVDRDGLIQGMIVGQRDWCHPNAFSEIKAILNLR